MDLEISRPAAVDNNGSLWIWVYDKSLERTTGRWHRSSGEVIGIKKI